MMKKFISFLFIPILLMGLIGFTQAVSWDTKSLFTGGQMTPYGAPWIADDQTMYFGTNKDVTIKYDELTDNRFEITGATYFANAVTFASNPTLGAIGTTGTIKGDSSLTVVGPAVVGSLKSNSTISATTAIEATTTIRSAGAATFASVKSNATVSAVGAIDTGGVLRSAGAATLASVKSNATVSAVGAIETGSTLRAAGVATVNALAVNTSATFGRPLGFAVNASTTIDTTLTTTTHKTFYPINAAATNVTLTLPDAALVEGREYIIKAIADPSTHFVIVNATGGDQIDGNTKYVSTSALPMVRIISDGSAYHVVGELGTWTASD